MFRFSNGVWSGRPCCLTILKLCLTILAAGVGHALCTVETLVVDRWFILSNVCTQRVKCLYSKSKSAILSKSWPGIQACRCSPPPPHKSLALGGSHFGRQAGRRGDLKHYLLKFQNCFVINWNSSCRIGNWNFCSSASLKTGMWKYDAHLCKLKSSTCAR